MFVRKFRRIPGPALALAGISLVASCAREPAPEYTDLLQSVVETERAFAQAAVERGVKEAFQAFLSEDAVLFRPRAVNAQDWLREQPATPGVLSWEPAYADVSAAGDLGFTTGPWSFSPAPDQSPVAHGNYFTFWKKQADDSWKAVIDHGTINPPPATAAVRLESPTSPLAYSSWRVDEAERGEQVEALLQTDRAFAGAAVTGGRLQALTTFVTPAVITLRNGRQPLKGIDAIRGLIAGRPGRLTWNVQGGDVARSGDLAYSYGKYEFAAAEPPGTVEVGNYLRAWRRQATGSWRVVVDLMTPLPPSQGGAGE